MADKKRIYIVFIFIVICKTQRTIFDSFPKNRGFTAQCTKALM